MVQRSVFQKAHSNFFEIAISNCPDNLDAFRRRRPMKFLPCITLHRINRTPFDQTPTWLLKEMGDILASVITDNDKQVIWSRSFPTIVSHCLTTVKEVVTGSNWPNVIWTNFKRDTYLKVNWESHCSHFTVHTSLSQLLVVHQSAYRQSHSTETAVLICTTTLFVRPTLSRFDAGAPQLQCCIWYDGSSHTTGCALDSIQCYGPCAWAV